MYFTLKQNKYNAMIRDEEIIEAYNFAEACGAMGMAIVRGASYAELWQDGKLVAHAHPKGINVEVQTITNERNKAT